MCGRFALSIPIEELMDYFEVEEVVEFLPRYNIAPSQPVMVVRANENNQRDFAFLRWGLIPPWQKEEDIGSDWINARAETVSEKPLFKSSFQKKRCLIVAEGFYEWKKGKTKVPYFIHKKDNKPLAFAGLWEHWENQQGKIIESCTILTSEANRLLETIHTRMPVILQRTEFESWLNVENQNLNKLQLMLRAYEPENLDAYPVSTFVNNPTHEGRNCIAPA